MNFTKMLCEGCGAERLASQSCDVCNRRADPREVDDHVVARRRAVYYAMRACSRPCSQDEPAEVLEVWELVERWLDRFLAAVEMIAEAAPDEVDTNSLAAAVLELQELDDRVRLTPRRRPTISLVRAAGDVIETSRSIVNEFMSALATDLPLTAQRAAENGQRAIDRLAALAVALSAKLARHQSLVDSSESDPVANLKALVLTALDNGPARDAIDLDNTGQVLYERVTGSHNAAGGIGFGLVLTQLQVEVLLDEARFWNMANDTYLALLSDRGRFKCLIERNSWLEEYREATRAMFDAGVAAEALARAASHRRHEVQAVLRLGRDLLEGPGRFFMATLLDVTGCSAFEDLIGKDATVVRKKFGGSAMSELATGLDRTIRNADSHNEYSVAHDRVTFSGRSREYDHLMLDDLLDRVLCGAESVRAMHAGVICAASELELDVADLDPLGAILADAESVTSVLLTAFGWKDVSVSLEGSTLHIRAEANLAKDAVKHVIMLCPYLDGSVNVVEFLAVEGSGSSRISGSLDSIREWRAEPLDSSRRDLLFVAMQLQWLIDGRPSMSLAEIRRWSASKMARYLTCDDYQVAIRGLKDLRDFGRRVGDPEIANLAERCARVARLRKFDTMTPADVAEAQAVFARIEEWASDR